MAIGLINFPNITAPSGDFPSGRIKDNPGDRSGTPLNVLTNGDIQEFFAKLMRMSDITPNELPDSEYSGHQFIQALLTVGFESISNPIIKAFLEVLGYTEDDVVTLSGTITLTNSNNTATWTEGSIYYNGNTYRLEAGTVTKTNPQTFLYVIDSEDEFTVTLIAGTAGDPDAIAEYGDATIKPFLWSDDTAFNTFNTGWSSEFTNIYYSVSCTGVKKVWGFVTLGTFSSQIVCTLPTIMKVTGTKPGMGVEHIARARITSGGSGFVDVTVNHNGQLKIDCDSGDNGKHYTFSLTYR